MSTPRPKILMLTTQLGYGGAETSFIRLANFLAQSMEVTVALFTRDYGAGAYAAGHEPLHASIVLLDDAAPCGRARRWWRRIRRIRQLKRDHAATISFLSGPNLANVLAGYNRRSIISLRGSRRYDPVAPRLQKLLFEYMADPLMFRLAARIVPVSAGLGNEIRRSAGARALAKMHVISPFIDAQTLPARLAELPPSIYAPLKGQPVIVAVGRLSAEKGFHHLIRVFAALCALRAGIKLLLVGDGPMLATLRTLCSHYGLAMDDVRSGTSAVIFAGYQKNALPLMALGSVYAMASATEGFPNVVVEAMAAGLPIIAADTPWGARAVLSPESAAPTEPYPTHTATKATYGMLMPRIDAPEYETLWAQTLLTYVDGSDAYAPPTEACLRAVDMAQVGQQWKALLHAMGVA